MRDIVEEQTERHYREEEEYERKVRDLAPECRICGEKIEDEYFYFFGGDECYCEDCMDREYRKRLDDYIEERFYD